MKTQFNMTVAVKNIIAMRLKAKRNDVAAGVAWYANAYDACMAIALRYDVPVHIVVGVVAALSPNNRWNTNLVNGEAIVRAFLDGDGMDSVSVCTYTTMKRKAWSILEAMPMRYKSANADGDNKLYDEVKPILNGKKIVCFYENIMGDDTCTIDGHARNIAYNERVNLTDNRTNIGIKEYANLQEAYRQAAKRCKVDGRQMKPYELQAITWVTWRKLHGIA